MSGIKISKKFTSYFLSLMCALSCLFGVFDAKTYAAAKEYEAHVALFCDNISVAKQFVSQLYSYEYDGERKIFGAPGSGKSTEKAVIIDGLETRKYNVYFHVIDARWALNPNAELNYLIKNCTGAVILYDVLDPTLEPIIKSRTFYEEDVRSLLRIDTPLNNCVKYLQSFGRHGWWNALNFIMYNHESLDPEAHERYRESLNFYAIGVEGFYVDGDNKWSRNHHAWNTPGGINNVLGWVSGQVYRSIFMERSLTGEFGKNFKKTRSFEACESSSFGKMGILNTQVGRNLVYPVCGVLAATTLVAAGSALVYKLMSR